MLLKNGIEVSSASILKALSSFRDKINQLTARGRLLKASLMMIGPYPIKLDGKYAAVRLLIQYPHENNCHFGPVQARNTIM